MTAPLWLIVVVGALTDFFIVAGSGLGVAMVGKGAAEMPGAAEILLSTILGVVAMMKEVRSQLKLPPVEGAPSSAPLRAGLVLLALVAGLLTASPSSAQSGSCQFGVSGGPIAGLWPLNSQTATLTAGTVFAFTLPTTTATGSNTVVDTLMAVVTVTSGAINVWDNGSTPTSSTTVGGQPFGSCTSCAISFAVCGALPVQRFKAIPQSGSPTLVISYYGSAK